MKTTCNGRWLGFLPLPIRWAEGRGDGRPRLAKEFHPLLLPGCLGAIAALAQIWKLSEFYEFVATFTFTVCVCLIAAIPFGSEFQQRTFPLLLSQPLDRFRLWKEKSLAVMLTAGALLLLRILEGRPSFSDSAGIAGFLLLTVCSATFWTLIARSTIGGAVFSVTFQFFAILVVAGIGLLAEKLFGFDLDKVLQEELPHSMRIPIMLFAGLVCVAYGALFVWLGWRKFAALEFTEAAVGETALGLESIKGRGWSAGWLRCRPGGRIANLVRKELRLQRPVLLGAAILSACWIATMLVFWLTPLTKETLQAIFPALVVCFVAFIPMIASLISVAEEKTLGTAQWHLTLPMPAWRQWLIKLLTAFSVAVCLGGILPWGLAWVAVAEAVVGLMEGKENTLASMATIIGITFVLSFWAATLLDSAVRSVLGAIVALAVIAIGFTVGNFCLLGLQTGLLQVVIARFQLPLNYLQESMLSRLAPL